jgi:hypothetical protein
MRYITDQDNANYKVPYEVQEGIDALVERCRRPPERGGLGVKADSPEGQTAVKKTHVAAWLLARALALPPKQLEQFLIEGRQVTDEHLAKDDPYPIVGDRPCDGPGPGSVSGDPVTERPIAARRLPGRRKDGDGAIHSDKPGSDRRKTTTH